MNHFYPWRVYQCGEYVLDVDRPIAAFLIRSDAMRTYEYLCEAFKDIRFIITGSGKNGAESYHG